jgi:hypothetical protein
MILERSSYRRHRFRLKSSVKNLRRASAQVAGNCSDILTENLAVRAKSITAGHRPGPSMRLRENPHPDNPLSPKPKDCSHIRRMTDPTPLPLTERFAQLIEGVFRLVCVCFAHDPVTLALIARILARIGRAGDPLRIYDAAGRVRRPAVARPAPRINVRSRARRAAAAARARPQAVAQKAQVQKAQVQRAQVQRAQVQRGRPAPRPEGEPPPVPIVRRGGQLMDKPSGSILHPVAMSKIRADRPGLAHA